MKKTKQQIIDELSARVIDLEAELSTAEERLEKEVEDNDKARERRRNTLERKDEETRIILAELVELLPHEVRSEYHKHYTSPMVEFNTKNFRPGGIIKSESGDRVERTINRLKFAIAYGIGNLVSRTDIDTNPPKQKQS